MKKAPEAGRHRRRDTLVIALSALGLFALMMLFFSAVHPLVLHDGDDWGYSSYSRGALPIWGYWNPSRVLPEILSPVCASAAAYLVMPIVGDFNAAYTLTIAFVVSTLITLYALMLVRLLRQSGGCTVGTAMLLSSLFIILHFLSFRTQRTGNDHLFYSWNVNTYLNYTIPSLLNAVLVLMWAGAPEHGLRVRPGAGQGFLLLLVYLALFSHLFSSQILGIYLFVCLAAALARALREGRGAWRRALSGQSWLVLGLLLWGIALFFELSGSRAGELTQSASLTQRFLDTLRGLLARLRMLNAKFVGVCVISVAGALLLFALRRQRDEEDGRFIALFVRFLVCGVLSGVYTVLLCTVTSPEYMRRTDVVFPCAFFLLTAVMLSLGYIVRRMPRAVLVLPLLGLVLIFETDTRVQTFREPNIDQLTPRQCAAINDAIMGQIRQADEAGVTELDVDVPEGSFFFLSDAMMRTMLKCGMIDSYIHCTNVEVGREEFFARYGI